MNWKMSQMSVNMEICDGMNLVERAIKKGLDTIFALLGLGILSPVFLLVYIFCMVYLSFFILRSCFCIENLFHIC